MPSQAFCDPCRKLVTPRLEAFLCGSCDQWHLRGGPVGTRLAKDLIQMTGVGRLPGDWDYLDREFPPEVWDARPGMAKKGAVSQNGRRTQIPQGPVSRRLDSDSSSDSDSDDDVLNTAVSKPAPPKPKPASARRLRFTSPSSSSSSDSDTERRVPITNKQHNSQLEIRLATTSVLKTYSKITSAPQTYSKTTSAPQTTSDLKTTSAPDSTSAPKPTSASQVPGGPTTETSLDLVNGPPQKRMRMSDQKAMSDSDTSSDSSCDSDTEYPEYPARFDQANLMFVRGGTLRGNDKLVEKQGYAFTVQRKNKNSTRWQCINYCPAKILQCGNTFTMDTFNHNHYPDGGLLTETINDVVSRARWKKLKVRTMMSKLEEESLRATMCRPAVGSTSDQV